MTRWSRSQSSVITRRMHSMSPDAATTRTSRTRRPSPRSASASCGAPDVSGAGADVELVRAFDPLHLSPAFLADPYPTYRALRELAPVHRCPDGSWFLTRYADLEHVYRSREHFSSDKKAAFGPKYGIDSPLYEHHT